MTASTDMSRPINRREFLYYLFGASMVVFAAESCALFTRMVQPHLSYGPGSGLFRLQLADVPMLSQPTAYTDAKAWLVRFENGLVAYSAICTYERNVFFYTWSDVNLRFECPGCGSKFTAHGAWLEGPAPRDLDRFLIRVETPRGIRSTQQTGAPVDVSDATAITLDTTLQLVAPPHAAPRWR